MFHYNLWFTDELWIPEGGVETLLKGEDGTPLVPYGRPAFIEESFEKQNFEDIKKGIAAQKLHMNYTQWTWWERFLENQSVEDIGEVPVWWIPDFTIQENLPNRSQEPLPLCLFREKEEDHIKRRQAKVNKKNLVQTVCWHDGCFRKQG